MITTNTPNEPIATVRYKYNEDATLIELKQYIGATYSQHYATKNIQVMEFLIELGFGMSFALGAIIKYASRYGKKESHNRKDIMKMIHYGIILLHIHDTEIGLWPKKEIKS